MSRKITRVQQELLNLALAVTQQGPIERVWHVRLPRDQWDRLFSKMPANWRFTTSTLDETHFLFQGVLFIRS